MEVEKGPLCTVGSLTADLKKLGIETGDTILLHSSLRKLGWVCGGAEAVIEAFLEVIGPSGTLVVPTQTADNSDPAGWERPPVPKEWWDEIRASTPAYDPAKTRSREMGIIPEMVRNWPGALRSAHPQTSFAAVGENAKYITEGHALDCMMGEKSPLAKLEILGAKVVLLGVRYDKCTALHLAEYRLEDFPKTTVGFAAMVDGHRIWMNVEDIDVDDEDFEQIGKEFEEYYLEKQKHGAEDGTREQRRPAITKSLVGAAECTLLDAKSLVDFAVNWMKTNRKSKEKM